MSENYWFLAIRPKTLSMALVPVLVGSALALNGLSWNELGWAELAWKERLWNLLPQFNFVAMLVALAAALFIQIGTNLYNDAADYEKGADTEARLGPKRVVAQGWLSAKQVKRAAMLSFGLALVCGLYLVWLAGWPILLVGVLSLLAGYAYTGGPFPIAYTPLGEIFVITFFGVVAVAGSYYIQTFSLSLDVVLTGIAVGLPAAAVLLVNNYRDYNSDKQAGRKTLVILIGRNRARYLYGVLLLAPILITSHYYFPWIALPMALWLSYLIWVFPLSERLNQLLVVSAKYQLIFAILLFIALVY